MKRFYYSLISAQLTVYYLLVLFSASSGLNSFFSLVSSAGDKIIIVKDTKAPCCSKGSPTFVFVLLMEIFSTITAKKRPVIHSEVRVMSRSPYRIKAVSAPHPAPTTVSESPPQADSGARLQILPGRWRLSAVHASSRQGGHHRQKAAFQSGPQLPRISPCCLGSYAFTEHVNTLPVLSRPDLSSRRITSWQACPT